eukprot:gene6078-12263_t
MLQDISYQSGGRFSSVFILLLLGVLLTCIDSLLSSNQRLTPKGFRLNLNRIFVDIEECKEQDGQISVLLDLADARATHIRKVLKSNVGDILRAGILDLGSTDNSVVESKDGNGILLTLGSRADLKTNCRPGVDLILAVPRPLRLERLLPVISSMGVGRIVLIGASKVEKAFFGELRFIRSHALSLALTSPFLALPSHSLPHLLGSHLFRRPQELKAALVDGLSQAGVDSMLPEIIVRRHLQTFVSEELDGLFPPTVYRRVLAHPEREQGSSDIRPVQDLETGTDISSPAAVRFTQIPPLPSSLSPVRRVVVAVGPEGGWEDFELDMLAAASFHRVHMGSRVL